MQVSAALRRDYVSYTNLHRMMEVQGYTPVQRQRVSLNDFLPLRREWRQGNNRTIWFTKPGEPPSIGFFAATPVKGIKKAITEIIAMFEGITDKLNEDDPFPVVNPNFILILDELTSADARSALKPSKPSNIPRLERDPTVKKSQIRVFYDLEMQISVPDHVLSPEYVRIISTRDEQETLRKRFMRENKDMQLKDMFPLIRANDPLVRWYNAQVGDVIYFIRRDEQGKRLPYWRYVTPYLH